MPSDFTGILWEAIQQQMEQHEIEVRKSLALIYLLDQAGGYAIVTEADWERLTTKYLNRQVMAQLTEKGIEFKFNDSPLQVQAPERVQ